ncbi:MAG: transaldolase, partial [Thermomicrobiaceae bacterium]|nr:transaldolase [Thermomicrobiaceae bacterium]
AVEELIYQGVNVNITLLFSVDNYVQVTEAYLRGIERRVAAGLPVDAIASVASFFVSRVDTEVDKRLEQLIARTDDEGRRERLRALEGQVAIANAKVAYERFKEIFLQSERFQRLARENGARLQRPLWASTSTKNPKYSDVKYIEALIGPHTVETMAPVSVDAFRDHGVVAPTLDQGYEEAHRILDSLAEVGISYDDVTRFLQEQGVELFAKSYDSLIAGIAEKTRQVAGVTPTQGGGLGPFESSVGETVGRLAGERFAERLWRRDPTLWSSDPSVQAKIADRLGWLDVAERMLGEIDALARLAEDVRAARLQRAVLLGMGGSSLAPEVFQRTFGNQIDFPELLVLDTTDPDTIRRVTPTLDLERTLFIVSSKSGTTIETSSLAEYYWSLVTERLGERAGERFIAITDPGTPLEALARERRFRHVFLNPPDIGGRYSALSYFGLVPAATIGLNVRDLLE